MRGTTVVRRRSGGADRLFVSAADGRPLGWHDLASGDTHVDSPPDADLIGAAVARWVTGGTLVRRRAVDTLAVARRGPSSSEAVGPRSTEAYQRSSTRQPSPAPEDLRERTPGEVAVAGLLRSREATPPRGRWARLLGRSPLGPTAAAYGAVVAQRRVGRLLRGLGPQWHVLHGVPIGDGRHLDHLLVGRAGVVVLRSREHVGQSVTVDGSSMRASGAPVRDLRACEEDAARAARLLTGAFGRTVPVRGLVVVGDPRSLRATGIASAVGAVRSSRLVAWLGARPQVLSSVDVAYLAELAARPGTWGERDRGLTAQQREEDRARTLAGFVRLRREVTAAARVRSTWNAVVVAAAAVALVLVTPAVVDRLLA